MDRVCKTDSYRDIRSNRLYRIWCNMKTRCTNPNTNRYHIYGGRGIKVCDKWQTFKGFCDDMEKTYQKELTLDRIDNEKGYFKENCRWATYKEQGRNTRVNRMITYKGETMVMTDWANRLGIKVKTLSQRINGYGWSYERALNTGRNYFG